MTPRQPCPFGLKNGRIGSQLRARITSKCGVELQGEAGLLFPIFCASTQVLAVPERKISTQLPAVFYSKKYSCRYITNYLDVRYLGAPRERASPGAGGRWAVDRYVGAGVGGHDQCPKGGGHWGSQEFPRVQRQAPGRPPECDQLPIPRRITDRKSRGYPTRKGERVLPLALASFQRVLPLAPSKFPKDFTLGAVIILPF